jgi:hypothetical protein
VGPSRAKSLEKDAKMKARGRFLEHFGLRLTASGGSEPPWGRFGRHPGSVNSILFSFFSEKRDLSNSMPLSSGSATFASPGAQVGATWAQKSESNGPKLQVGGARTVKFGWSVRSCLRSYGNGSQTAQTPPHLKSRRRYKSI